VTYFQLCLSAADEEWPIPLVLLLFSGWDEVRQACCGARGCAPRGTPGWLAAPLFSWGELAPPPPQHGSLAKHSLYRVRLTSAGCRSSFPEH